MSKRTEQPSGLFRAVTGVACALLPVLLAGFSIYGADNRKVFSEAASFLREPVRAIGTLSVTDPDQGIRHRAGASLIWSGRCRAVALSVRHAVALLEETGDVAFHPDGPNTPGFHVLETVYPERDPGAKPYRDHPNDWALLVVDKPCDRPMTVLEPELHRIGFAEAFGADVWFACYHHDTPFSGAAAVQGGPDDNTGAVRPKRARAFFAEFYSGFSHVLLHDFDHRRGASGCPLFYRTPDGWRLVGVHSSQSALAGRIRDGRPFGVSSNAGVALAFSPRIKTAFDTLIRRLGAESYGESHD